MQLIRKILGAVILFLDRLFRPKPVSRPLEQQRALDARASKLALYQYEACPFCVKVRRHIERQALKIELRDALGNPVHARELVEQGGQKQVPCLRIQKDDGSTQWLYESSDIIAYLDTSL
ncbi:MAG: glutathione S-transferase N-terminal domain-containing protein [Deltaproteobacteria bacterium]|nr:glutathione S-transferase N-terminal domain-containing protein [Deltaproteobacteria bacterium]